MQEDRDDVKGGDALSDYLIEKAKHISPVVQIKSRTFHIKVQYQVQNEKGAFNVYGAAGSAAGRSNTLLRH